MRILVAEDDPSDALLLERAFSKVGVNVHLARRLVVILSASALAEDINRAYALGANSYLIKPQDFEGLERIATGLDNYWLKLNTPPN